jgi:SAM-dependent methyltransferase
MSVFQRVGRGLARRLEAFAARGTVAVLGFYSTENEAEKLRQTFDGFTHPRKRLFLHGADREGELHTLSNEVGEVPIACIHPGYAYPASYLDDLMADFDPTADAVWTADPAQKPGLLGDGSNPDVYRSLIPAHVFRLLYGSNDRHITPDRRSERTRGVELRRGATEPVEVNGALPNPLHEQNGLYWMIDYGRRMDRRCIEAYLRLRKLGADSLAEPMSRFRESLTSIQHRHLLYFLNTNVAGERAVNYIAEHIDLSTVRTAIDVGAGYGGLVKALCDRGCKATGLEIMARLLDLARINLAGYDAELIVGDFLTEKLPPDSYQLLTMTDVIEPVADPALAIARTAEILTPGGYAFIKIPNYRFIDYVRQDPHTGLFAITLLRHDPASAYLRAVRDMAYSVGEYYDHDWYIDTADKHGLSLVRSVHLETPIEEARELLERCRETYERWRSETEIDPEMKAMICDNVDGYLTELDRQLAAPDEHFPRDYLSSHWNMFFTKRG